MSSSFCIHNDSNFRSNIKNTLAKLVGNVNIANNLEIGVFNYSLEKAHKLNVVKLWSNQYFVQIYTDRLRSIYTNLTHNDDLLRKLQNKEIKAHRLSYMTHQEMNPEAWRELIEQKEIRDKHKYDPVLEASTNEFTCRRCKLSQCTYYQLQTRSADEPMTTFVSCINCGNKWKC
jgi:transcription elongation factor S-II